MELFHQQEERDEKDDHGEHVADQDGEEEEITAREAEA